MIWIDQGSHGIMFGSKVYWPELLKVLGHHQRHWQSESGPFGNWKRGGICLLPSFVDQNKISQLQGRRPSNVLAHGKQTKMRTICFFRWWGAPRLWSWKSEALWELFSEDLFSLARLGQGSIQQVQGEMMHQGISKRGTALMQSLRSSGGMPYQGKGALHPARDAFLHKSHRTWRLWHVQGSMAATRSCVCYVSNEDAGKWHAIAGECLATMLYKCFVHQVTTIGDANKMAHQSGQQLHFSYCVWAFYFGWTELSCEGIHLWIFARCEIWEPSTLPPMCVWSFWRNSLVRRWAWKRTSERRFWTLVIAVHWHFTSSGMSMYCLKKTFSELKKQTGHFLFLTNDLLLLLLRDRDTDSHCPFLMVWLEPSDLFNQEKKSFQSDAGRKERADKGKADQKARKAKGKANARSCGITSIRKDIFIDCCELPIRIDDGFQWRHPLLFSRLSFAASERSWLCVCRYHQVW